MEKKTLILKTHKKYYFTAYAVRSWIDLSTLEYMLEGNEVKSAGVTKWSIEKQWTNPRKVWWDIDVEDGMELPFALEIISADRYPYDFGIPDLAGLVRYDIKLTTHPRYYKPDYQEARVLYSVSAENLNKFLSDDWLKVEVIVKDKKEVFS